MHQNTELYADNVSKSFVQGTSRIQVLQNVSARFKQGTTYAITGASGAGKSTLLHLLGGMDMPDQGSVFFDGHALGTMPDKQRRHVWNTSFGLVFQNPYLINELTVLENVMLKGLAGGLNHTACVTTAQHLLKAVGLEDKMDSKPSTLSGGQQQRVALARALFGKPAFLLADELTGNLDATTGAALVDFLLKCQQEWHMGIILSTHDMGIASRMQERLCLREGRLVE